MINADSEIQALSFRLLAYCKISPKAESIFCSYKALIKNKSRIRKLMRDIIFPPMAVEKVGYGLNPNKI